MTFIKPHDESIPVTARYPLESPPIAPNTGYCFTPNPIETGRQLFNEWFNWGWRWRTWEEAKDHRKVLLFFGGKSFCFAGVQRKQWMKILQRNLMMGQSSVISVCVCVFGLLWLNQIWFQSKHIFLAGGRLKKTRCMVCFFWDDSIWRCAYVSNGWCFKTPARQPLPRFPGCSWKPLRKPSPKWDCPMRGEETDQL